MQTFNNAYELAQHCEKITDLEEKEQFVLAQLGEITERADDTFLANFLYYIVGEEQRNETLPVGLQIRALIWITENALTKYNESKENGNENAQKGWADEFYYCLWRFKWIVYELPNGSGLSYEEIEDYSNEMRRYYEMGGLSLAPYYKTVMLQAMRMGDVARAKENFALWQSTDSDEMADCEACEVAELVNYYHFIGEDEEVLELAEPILAGKLTCAEVPHIVYASVLKSQIRLGKWNAAKALLPIAIETLLAQPESIFLLGEVIACAVQLGEYDRAKALMAEHGETLFNYRGVKPLEVLHLFVAAAKFSPERLEQAQQICQAFDERNGNSYYSDYLANTLAERQIH